MKNFIELLKPQNIFKPKKRLGPSEDGGYVMPEFVFEECSALFTYGVGREIRFEEEFEKKYNKPVYLFDHTNGQKNWDRGHLHFISRGLGFKTNCRDFVEDYIDLGINGYVFLKIDIEGGEYDYFRQVEISSLADKVMGISLEVHWIDNGENRKHLEFLLNALNEYFILCHIHGNNWGDLWMHDGKLIPKVLELSFVNKKFIDNYEPDEQEYPIKGLDVANNPSVLDYKLSFLNPLYKIEPPKDGIMEHYYKSVPSGWFNYESIYQLALNRVPEGGTAHFVELWVWFGQSVCYAGVEIINSKKNIKLDGIDSFLVGDQPLPGASEDMSRYSEALRYVDPVKSVVNIIKADTHQIYKQYDDESIDFLFIDANHTYEDMKQDLEFWFPKIKKGGLICGHDYEERPWPGLVKAVDEFFGKENFEVHPCCWSWVHYKK